MIIERYLLKELLATLLAVISVLFLIFVSSWFARLLGQVSAGGIQIDMVFLLLSLKSLDALMILSPLALYLAVLLTFGRLYRDSEMAAMLACGVSPLRLLRLVFWLSAGFALLVATISLYFAPWANAERFALQGRMAAMTGLESVAGGQFRSLANGRLVFYAERLADDGKTMENVFIQGERDGVLNLVVADRAYRVEDEEIGGSYLVLEDGHRYEGNPGSSHFRIIDFKEHGLLIRERETVLTVSKTVAKPTLALLSSDHLKDQAELQWRLSMPISAVLLALLAVYLSKSNPRQGRYAKFFLGILIYVVYSNLLGVGKAWLEKGQVSPTVGLWWVHGLVLGVLVVLVLRQYRSQRQARRLLAGATK